MLHMLSELPPLSKVGADIVFEQDDINNFLNLFYNVYLEIYLVHNHHNRRIKIVPF